MRQNKQVWLYYVITYNATYIWTAICTCNLLELEPYTYILTFIFHSLLVLSILSTVYVLGRGLTWQF